MQNEMVYPYPYSLFSAKHVFAPLFQRDGEGYFFSLSGGNTSIHDLDPADPAAFQEIIEHQMKGRFTWGLAPYLEKRDLILRKFPQMTAEERFYHLGLDIVLQLNTPLFAPLAGRVADAGYESGAGNYGGYVVLEHRLTGTEGFFTLYGHLDPESLPAKGDDLEAGASLGRIGDFSVNGGWYHHTHLQIITRQGVQEGYLSRGYCSKDDLKRIHLLCPSPVPLLIRSLSW